jgi:glutamate-5-semialdehyde dehydrogenase
MEIDWKQNTLNASRELNILSDEKINEILLMLARETVLKTDEILHANQLDLDTMERVNPKYDRLLLNPDRIAAIADDIRNVASLASPLGKIISESIRPNGMTITKRTVPFGVVGVIFEARPKVSFDIFALCLKSGNACVLKGGTDAHNSNLAIVELIQNVLVRFGLDKNTVTLLPASREATQELLNAVGIVDLIIPRGGKALIDYVRNNSRVPVIETGAGICHSYFDEFADLGKAKNIVFNAKTRRVSVCNALDCLIIHEKRLTDLVAVCKELAKESVVIYADEKAFEALKNHYPSDLLLEATDESFGTEFLDYKMSVKTVTDIQEAIRHISKYSSKHSECILSENEANIELFEKMVDAACVYSNVSTAFTDGAQFGLGAEIGISTQKLHARGPMALEGLCSYKWIIKGEGQIRI